MATTVIPVRVVGRGAPTAWPDPCARMWLGIQRGKEVVDLRLGDAAEATFDLTLIWQPIDAGETGELRGPYAHGPRGARSLYSVGARSGRTARSA